MKIKAIVPGYKEGSSKIIKLMKAGEYRADFKS